MIIEKIFLSTEPIFLIQSVCESYISGKFISQMTAHDYHSPVAISINPWNLDSTKIEKFVRSCKILPYIRGKPFFEHTSIESIGAIYRDRSLKKRMKSIRPIDQNIFSIIVVSLMLEKTTQSWNNSEAEKTIMNHENYPLSPFVLIAHNNSTI